MKDEILRRQGKTAAVIALFALRPGVWIDAGTLAKVGGFCAWRTRTSDARKAFEQDGLGTVEWNGQVRESAYRFVPQTLKRETPATQMEMFS